MQPAHVSASRYVHAQPHGFVPLQQTMILSISDQDAEEKVRQILSEVLTFDHEQELLRVAVGPGKSVLSAKVCQAAGGERDNPFSWRVREASHLDRVAEHPVSNDSERPSEMMFEIFSTAPFGLRNLADACPLNTSPSLVPDVAHDTPGPEVRR